MKRLLAFSHAGVLDVNRALFQEMARVANVDIRLIVPENWKGDLIADLKFRRSDSDVGLKVISLPAVFSGNGSLFFYRFPMGRLMRGWKPHYVFVDEEPWSMACLQAFTALRKYPCAFFTKQNIHKNYPPPFSWIEKWVYAQSSHAYVVSDEVGDVLKAKGYKKKVKYLPHSYDPKIFWPLSPNERIRRREELKLPREAVVIAYFGRLTEEKGIHDLIDAMRQMQSNQKCHFFFVGNGPLSQDVAQAIQEMPHGRASLIEAIPHHRVGKAIAACDVLVLPSRTTPTWKEQYGRVLVEAMACGLAVVGSDSGEIPYLIARTGGGLSFAEKNPKDLAEKLETLVQSPETLKKYADAGLAYVQKHLTHEAVARYLCQDLGIDLKDAGSNPSVLSDFQR